MSTGPPVDLGPGSRARHRPRPRGLWRAAAEGQPRRKPAKAERRSPEYVALIAPPWAAVPSAALPDALAGLRLDPEQFLQDRLRSIEDGLV